VNKGFSLEFDSKHWAEGWVINPLMTPASISLVEGESTPDGKRYLNVKTIGATHIFAQESISGEDAYKISFMARGESFMDKAPTIVVYAYLYTKDKQWVGRDMPLETFSLTNAWESYSIDLPSVGDGLVAKIAFRFLGSCDLDHVKVESVRSEK
jgi:hypothetical protein